MLSSYPTDIGPIPGKSLRQIAAEKERENPSKKPDTVFQVTPHIRSVNGKLETVIPGADAAKQHQGAQDKKARKLYRRREGKNHFLVVSKDSDYITLFGLGSTFRVTRYWFETQMIEA